MEKTGQLQEIKHFKKKLEERFNIKIEIYKMTRKYTAKERAVYIDDYIVALDILPYVCVTRRDLNKLVMYNPYFRKNKTDIFEKYYRHEIVDNDFEKIEEEPQLVFDF